MTKKKATAASHEAPSYSGRKPSTYHRLDALLHTMRCIAQHEDVLCELSHELKRQGYVSPEMSAEIGEILDKIPAHDFILDLEAVKVDLPAKKQSTKSKATNFAELAQARIRSTAVKKSGRKSSK